MIDWIHAKFEYVKQNILLTLLISITFTLLAPLLFTIKHNITWLDFTETGPIGDTIGGITAPFINIINAILIYIAFTEQLNANKLLKDQIDLEGSKEEKRLEEIRNLILFDLQFIILPNLDKIEKEIVKFLQTTDDGNIKTHNNHVEFNDYIYKNVSHSDLLKAFPSNFKDILHIYNRVEYISTVTPLKLINKYPTDRDSLALIKLNDEEYERLKARNNAKIHTIISQVPKTAILFCRSTINIVLFVHGK